MVFRTNSFLLAAMAPLFLGCGEKEDAPDPCNDTAQLELDAPADEDLVATITYDELIEIKDKENTAKSTILTANFADLSNYDITTKATPFNHSCVGILGRPTPTGDPIPLIVDSVTIQSKPTGQTTIEKDANDNYFLNYDGRFFSKTGGETISIDVTSSGKEGMYPAFNESVTAPAALENYSAAVTSDGTVLVEWTESNSTYLEIVLRSIADNDDALENRVRCFFLADDGCFEVPYSAVEWLISGGAEKIKVRMERHMSKLSKPAKNAILEIDAMRSIEFNISI